MPCRPLRFLFFLFIACLAACAHAARAQGSLHLTHDGLAASDPLLTMREIRARGGVTVSVRLRTGPWQGGPGVYQDRWRLVRVSDGKTLLSFGTQNSPWHQANFHTAIDLNGGVLSGDHSWFFRRSPARETFEEFDVTLIPPSAAAPGRLLGYNDGVLALASSGGPTEPYDEVLPAGDYGWSDSDAFRLVLGNGTPYSQDRQDVWFAEASVNCGGKIFRYPDDPLALSGSARVSGAVYPNLPGFGPGPDTTPPSVGIDPWLAEVTETSCRVAVPDLGEDPRGCVASVFLTRGNADYRSIYIAKSPVESGEALFPDLSPGVPYEAVVEWEDGAENIRTVRLPFRTPGAPDPLPPARAYTFEGDVTETIGEQVKYPNPADGLTVSFWVKRLPGDTGALQVLGIRDGGFEYATCLVKLRYGYPQISIDDGDHQTGLASPVPAGTGVWEQWTAGVKYPRETSQGYLRLYRGLELIASEDLPAATTRETDWSFKKWECAIRGPGRPLDEAPAGLAVKLAHIAVYDAAPGELIESLVGRDPRRLSEQARLRQTLLYDGQEADGLMRPSGGYLVGTAQGWDLLARSPRTFTGTIPRGGYTLDDDLPDLPGVIYIGKAARIPEEWLPGPSLWPLRTLLTSMLIHPFL